MKQKIIVTVVILFFVLTLGGLAFAVFNTTSQLMLNGEHLIAVNAPARSARIDNPNKHAYAYFRFTENQKNFISHMQEQGNGAAVQITLALPAKKNVSHAAMPFAFGLLYDEDFKDGYHLKSEIVTRPLIHADLALVPTPQLSLAYSLLKDGQRPCGFFVYGTTEVSVHEVLVTEAKLGWYRSDVVPLFAFGPSGGTVDFDFSSFDFSDGKQIFSSQNTRFSIMPKVVVNLREAIDIGTAEHQTSISAKYGTEGMLIRLAKNQRELTLQTSAFTQPFSTMVFTTHSDMVLSVLMSANKMDLLPREAGGSYLALTPLKTDLGLVPGWPQQNWRCHDYELYQWSLFPEVLFFDFVDYKIQNQFFTRLAFFVEKEGYKGTLVDNGFIETKHGYNAHDYRAVDLAAFFSCAAKTNFKLNRNELVLRDILVTNGVIVPQSDGTYGEGHGAIVSISRESAGYLRFMLMAHECWHGIYFTTESFREVVADLYNSFDEKSMLFLKKYWEKQPSLAYDLSNEYLMQNEFMAYLLQQPVSATAEWFLTHAKWNSVQRDLPNLANYVIEHNASFFTEACQKLSDYAFATWGLAAGRVFLVSRR